MTENEIIDILKENKIKGIGYKFLPEEVQKWIYDNFYKDYLVYFNYQSKWISINDINLTKSCNYQNYIFSLSEDFELNKELEGEWVEFKIRDDGYFNSDIGLYLWFDWQKFLKFSYNHDIGFTSFGGWQYDDGSKVCKTWNMQPMIFSEVENKLVNLCLCNEQEKTKPVIPIKIRFWRISK